MTATLLTVREAASFLGVTIERVRQLCTAGKLPYVYQRYGWRPMMRFIPREALEQRRREQDRSHTP